MILEKQRITCHRCRLCVCVCVWGGGGAGGGGAELLCVVNDFIKAELQKVYIACSVEILW